MSSPATTLHPEVASLEVGDPDLVNLWAGVNHELARTLPAAQIIAELSTEIGTARGNYSSRG